MGAVAADAAQELSPELKPALKVVISETNPVPFAMFSTEGRITGGIAKLLMDQAGILLEQQVLYLDIPRARVEKWLISGQADIGCFLSPDWVSQPAQLGWIGPLFYSSQFIVRRAGTKPIQQLSDLFNKRVGTIRGFVYPELEQAFTERLIQRDDAHSLESNLARLAQGRLDAVMAVDLSYGYVMNKQSFSSELTYDLLWTAPPAIYCAYNQSALQQHRYKAIFEEMAQSGFIDHLIKQYEPKKSSL